MNNKPQKKKVKIVPFFKYLTFVMIVVTVLTLGLFKFMNILPGEYLLVLCVLLVLITLCLSSLILTRKGPKKRIIGTLLSLFYIILLIVVIIYELNTIGFLKKLGFKNYKTENYSVLVLKDSNYNSIKDIDKKTIGSLTLNTEGLKDARDKLEKKISPKLKEYEDVTSLKNDFVNKHIDAILIEESILSILTEDDASFKDIYKVIYDFSLDVETEDITEHVDITKDTFNVFVSGIDTYGTISSVSRSDVNMVLTVNPKTHKILITSIPRDYYVQLYGKNAKDKLTHAGIYGVDMSVKTLEQLLDIKINYYVKVNFTSVIKIVDTLGGVNVYSKYNFTSMDGYSYKAGYNYVDGKKALSFVRERKSFNEGDRMRVENQAAMIRALIDKATSPAIITKYNNFLNTLSNSFVTNLDTDSITSFIKMQIADMPKWEVENYSLNGTDDYQYTYSYRGAKLYVMEPDQETVTTAKEKIKELQNK